MAVYNIQSDVRSTISLNFNGNGKLKYYCNTPSTIYMNSIMKSFEGATDKFSVYIETDIKVNDEGIQISSDKDSFLIRPIESDS